MNKHLKDIIIKAEKVPGEYKQQSMSKTYHVSESQKAHKAYIVKCEDYDDLPLELSGAKYNSTHILSARVVENRDQLDTFVSDGEFDVEEITIPAGADRDAFFKEMV